MPKLIFLLVFLVSVEASGQLLKSNRLYVGNGAKYILSEKADINTDKEYPSSKNKQEFNTLFIWQKDKVIRIVFKYESKLANKQKIDISQLSSLDRLLPAFKREKIYYRSKKNSSKRYDECYCKRPGGKFYYSAWNDRYNLDDYKYRFKENINKWNEKHNPLADKFNWIQISDGNPEVFEKNKKRQKNYVNNLPLVFDSPKHDSLYLIKPYYINVYHLDFDKRLNTGTYYELYSTISLMDDFFRSGTNELELNEHHNETKWQEYDSGYRFGMENFIASRTLTSLFKFNIPYGEASAINFMSYYDLPKPKTYTTLVNSDVAVLEKSVRNDTIPDKRLTVAENIIRIKLNKRRIDSLDKIDNKKQDSVIKAYKEDCYGHYQFCSECYNTDISKTERLRRGCPVNVAPAGMQSESNWSYGLSTGNINYFKVENTYYNIATSNNVMSIERRESIIVFDYSYPVVWQLMSPGIGFWLSNVSVNSRQIVPLNVKGLKLNNKPIKPF